MKIELALLLFVAEFVVVSLVIWWLAERETRREIEKEAALNGLASYGINEKTGEIRLIWANRDTIIREAYDDGLRRGQEDKMRSVQIAFEEGVAQERQSHRITMEGMQYHHEELLKKLGKHPRKSRSKK